MTAFQTLDLAQTAGHKQLAQLLAQAVREAGQTLSHVQALHCVASLHGLPNWNTLEARPATPRLNPVGAAPALAKALQARQVTLSDDHIRRLAALPTPINYVAVEDIIDTPSKSQVAATLILTGQVTEAELRKLLLSEYERYAHSTGFNFRQHPNSIFIWAYMTQEQADSGAALWAGMGMRSAYDFQTGKPFEITIRPEVIASHYTHLPQRFGLSAEQRKRVFLDHCRATNRARVLADGEYPDVKDVDPNQTKKRELLERWNTQIAERFGIPADAVDDIAVEGLMHKWPMDTLSATQIESLKLRPL